MPKSKYHKTTKQLFSCSGVWLSPVQANIEWWTTDYINTSAWTSLFRASRKRIFRWWLKHPFRESETVTSEDSASDSEASIGHFWITLHAWVGDGEQRSCLCQITSGGRCISGHFWRARFSRRIGPGHLLLFGHLGRLCHLILSRLNRRTSGHRGKLTSGSLCISCHLLRLNVPLIIICERYARVRRSRGRFRLASTLFCRDKCRKWTERRRPRRACHVGRGQTWMASWSGGSNLTGRSPWGDDWSGWWRGWLNLGSCGFELTARSLVLNLNKI